MTVKRCWVDTAEQRTDCTAIKEFKIGLHLLILHFRASGMLGVVGIIAALRGESASANFRKVRGELAGGQALNDLVETLGVLAVVSITRENSSQFFAVLPLELSPVSGWPQAFQYCSQAS